MFSTLSFLISAWLVTLLFIFSIQAESQEQHVLEPEHNPPSSPICFFGRWQTLGPFQIGTREASWGADPLEQYGGFPNLPFDLAQTYTSSLAPNATVEWNENDFETSCSSAHSLVHFYVDHDNIDWAFQRGIYGWAALQYQTWTRGTLLNAKSSNIRIALYATNILELVVNGQHHFGGDFYGFERVPIILDLRPGHNSVAVRLIRDVRANGGHGPPSTDASLRANPVHDPIGAIERNILVPDMVCGRFVSHHASVTLTNYGDELLVVDSIKVESSGRTQTSILSIRIAPGQSRPVNFMVNELSFVQSPVAGLIRYSVSKAKTKELRFSFKAKSRDRYEPQKLTFLHPSGAVSYAILRPPSRTVVEQAKDDLPVLLVLHGAGLEADSYQVRHSFDAIPDLPAWLLFPTGMSPWSGDDWHTWGFADVRAALSGIQQWIATTDWPGTGASISRYVVCGHSNGGQGAWHLALHQPDRVIAAAVASGYSSIENYVPYTMWNDADSLQKAILQSARSSYKHELFFPNMVSTPILIQHGQDDNNVPPYHGRLMKSLASRAGANVTYMEFPTKGHWWDEAMVTDPMARFYSKHLASSESETHFPEVFGCVIGNSHDFGSCMGIVVDQLGSPDILAQLRITRRETFNATFWHIRTENIRRFHLDFSLTHIAPPDAISVDKEPTIFEIDDRKRGSFRGGRCGIWWVRENEESWRDISERYGRQRGPMDAILRTEGRFHLVYDSPTAFSVAVQISRNLLQYYAADADIHHTTEYANAVGASGNLIFIASEGPPPQSHLRNFPIQVKEEMVEIRSREGVSSYVVEGGIGGAWLRPLPYERLELIIWGSDEVGLRQAARMAPTLTGAGQPDFILFRKEAAWEGVSGTLALGFLDYSWNVSAASYLRG